MMTAARSRIRSLAAPVSMIAGLALVTSCGSPPETTGGNGALQMAVWSYSIETVNDNLKQFTAANPGVNVELADYPWNNYHDVMATKFTGGSPPDVQYSSDHWLEEWVAADWIAPVEEHCPTVAQYKSEWPR